MLHDPIFMGLAASVCLVGAALVAAVAKTTAHPKKGARPARAQNDQPAYEYPDADEVIGRLRK